jgi:hypothetical protein
VEVNDQVIPKMGTLEAITLPVDPDVIDLTELIEAAIKAYGWTGEKWKKMIINYPKKW